MFNIFKKVFKRTNEAIKEVAPKKKKKITQDEFEDILLEADVNYELVEKFLEDMPKNIDRGSAYNALISVFQYKANWKHEIEDKLYIYEEAPPSALKNLVFKLRKKLDCDVIKTVNKLGYMIN